MLFDYIGIVPAIAAGIMGLITLMSKDMPTWKKLTVTALTVIAISATSLSQWWSTTKKTKEQAERTVIREQLGQFEDQASKLIVDTINNDVPLPQGQAEKWAAQVELFLKEKLGPSYVIRLRSDSGLPMQGFPIGILIDRTGLLQWLNSRVARLDQFASEIPR